MMFNELLWWFEMLMTRRWDVFEICLFWDAFEMLIWDVFEMIWDVFNLSFFITFMVVSHTLHFFEMELMLVEMACIGEFWDEGYALLMPLLIGRFLRWEFCSNGTTCICIVLSRIIWMKNEMYLMLMNEYVCCNCCWLWDETGW